MARPRLPPKRPAQRARAWAASALVLAVVALLALEPEGPPAELLNRLTAVTGTALIAVSFLLGPLWRLHIGRTDASEYRKVFGMVGFGLVAVHAAIALTALEGAAFAPENAPSVAAGGLALAIFSLLAASSSRLVLAGIGYQRWLAIQRTGYAALALVLLHVGLLRELGPLAWTAWLLVLSALLARILELLVRA